MPTESKDMRTLITDHYVELLGEPAIREHTLNLEALHLPTMNLSDVELPLRAKFLW
jgi:hypothetical protein